MKGKWESNINVWFPFMNSQKWNCAASLFPKHNYHVLSPNSYTLTVYLWEIYVFPVSVYLFCCNQICGPILGIYKSRRHMNVGIGTEASLFLFWEYINWIFGTVQKSARSLRYNDSIRGGGGVDQWGGSKKKFGSLPILFPVRPPAPTRIWLPHLTPPSIEVAYIEEIMKKISEEGKNRSLRL